MYPVTYEADYKRDRKRFTTFFRLLLAIPWLIVSYVYQLLLAVAIVISWIVIIVIGRYPNGLYNFAGGVLRFQMRLTGWMYLQTDAWPPFGFKDDPSYPIRINYLPPALKQSRFQALIRIILVLPLVLMYLFISSIISAVAVVAWITIVFRGYQPAAIHNALAWSLGWETRFRAYAYLMRDEYPPVGDEVLTDVDPSAGPPALPAHEPPVPEAAQYETDAYGNPIDPIQEAPFTGAPLEQDRPVGDPYPQQYQDTQPPVAPQYQDTQPPQPSQYQDTQPPIAPQPPVPQQPASPSQQPGPQPPLG